jgi:hypothetical protein
VAMYVESFGLETRHQTSDEFVFIYKNENLELVKLRLNILQNYGFNYKSRDRLVGIAARLRVGRSGF